MAGGRRGGPNTLSGCNSAGVRGQRGHACATPWCRFLQSLVPDVVRAVPEIFGPLDAQPSNRCRRRGRSTRTIRKRSPGAGGIGAEIEKALRAEIDHLKGALRKADATVVDLYAPGLEEMSALAEKLTAGLRRPDPGTRESTSDRPVDAAADDAQKDLKTQEARFVN